MKKRKIIFALFSLTMLGGCGPAAKSYSPPLLSSHIISTDAETLPAPEGAIEDSAVDAMSDFSLKLFTDTLNKYSDQDNILISPTSTLLALGMAQNGAVGDTLDQMEIVLNGGLSIEEMNPAYYDLSNRLESSEDVKWNIANSIWYKDDGNFTPKSEFILKARDWYGAGLFSSPFDDNTLTDINNWASNETSGMIPKILSNIPTDASVYLINAIAFEGEWDLEYGDSEILENYHFSNADGSNPTVTMLKSGEINYFHLGEGIGFLRPYKGNQYSFFAILPDEGISTADYILGLNNDGAALSNALRNPSHQKVEVLIPEFSVDFETEMSNTLTDMGMDLPFNKYRADFSNMADFNNTPDTLFYISNMIQKTHLELDRKGTRAVVVTSEEMDCMPVSIDPAPIFIYLDRPFVYGIVDNETGLPIFIGCMNNM